MLVDRDSMIYYAKTSSLINEYFRQLNKESKDEQGIVLNSFTGISLLITETFRENSLNLLMYQGAPNKSGHSMLREEERRRVLEHISNILIVVFLATFV